MISRIVDYSFPEEGNGPYRLFRGIEGSLVERFEAGLRNPREAQLGRLEAILAEVEGTAFGAAHGLRPGVGLGRFRELVPVRDYDGLREWMERVHEGKRRVLTKSPVRSLLKTSGTTGRAKLLPVTETYAREVREGQSLWRLALIRDHEAVTRGKALTVVSPAVEGRLPSGLRFGSNTGRMQDEQPWLVRLRYPIPRGVASIEDSEARIYALLRFALQARISTITTANPSTVLLLCRKLLEHREDLARDLAEGTCRYGPAPRLGLAARLRLRVSAVPDDWRPARIWDLATVNCWKGGPARFVLARLGDALGGEVPIRELGITASEGYFAIPMSDGDEGGVAWLGGHVLEFVDEDGPHWAWELEVGRCYRLVVTTSGGLYRYDLNDLVEVTGFAGGAPLLRFVRKGRNVLNVTGEKVAEEQVVAVVSRLAPGLEGFTLGVRMGEVPTYVLAVEGPHEGLGRRLDGALRQANVEYDNKRDTQRLAPAEVLALPPGSYARYRAARVAGGAPEGQVKDLVLAVSEEDWERLMDAARLPGSGDPG